MFWAMLCNGNPEKQKINQNLLVIALKCKTPFKFVMFAVHKRLKFMTLWFLHLFWENTLPLFISYLCQLRKTKHISMIVLIACI